MNNLKLLFTRALWHFVLRMLLLDGLRMAAFFLAMAALKALLPEPAATVAALMVCAGVFVWLIQRGRRLLRGEDP